MIEPRRYSLTIAVGVALNFSGIAFPAFAAPSARAIFSEMQQLDQALVKKEKELDENIQNERSLGEKLAAAEITLAQLRSDEAAAYALYQKRIRAIHKQPMGARLAMLGGTRSLQDFLQSNRLLRQVAKYDRRILSEFKQQRQRLQSAEEKLSQQKQRMQRIVGDSKLARDSIAKRRQEKVQFLNDVDSSESLKSLSRQQKAQARRALGVMVSRLKPRGELRSAFAANRGRLPWPVSGKISARFGEQIEMAHGTTITHNGWDLRAASGTPVQIVAAGKVVFAGWLESYGQVVIVDHGEGYHSIYAHLGVLLASKDLHIIEGTQIGTTGDTGSLRGTVLYFELRHNGTPVDPLRWLRQ